jgi:hypothetical protein
MLLMISAIVFVLFVRDKYTTNTLLESIVESPLTLLLFVPDGEHDEIKKENANSIWIIEMVILITR